MEGCLSGEHEDGVMEDVFLDVTDELFLLGGYLILLEEVPTVAKLSSSSQKSEECAWKFYDDLGSTLLKGNICILLRRYIVPYYFRDVTIELLAFPLCQAFS